MRSFGEVEERRGGEKLKFEKKTIALILAVAIGLSLFVGLASAAGRNDPISQILELVLGIDAKINDVQANLGIIDTKVDDVQTDLEKTTQMLGSFSGHFESLAAAGSGVITNAKITSDKPALFTVSINAWLKDPGDVVWVAQAPNKWFWATMVDQPIMPGNSDGTFTISGYGVSITYYNKDPSNLEVTYCIIVQGEKGTEVKIGEWT